MSKGWSYGSNEDLWEKVLTLSEQFDITWVKVKGHSGNEYNEGCDVLAKRCARNGVTRRRVDFGGIEEIMAA